MGGLESGAKCLKLLGSKVVFLGALMGFFQGIPGSLDSSLFSKK